MRADPTVASSDQLIGQTPYVVHPGTDVHVPEEHAVPGVHTRRQRLLMHTRPSEHSSVRVHEEPVRRLPPGPQSVNSSSRLVSSRRQRSPKSSQPSAITP